MSEDTDLRYKPLAVKPPYHAKVDELRMQVKPRPVSIGVMTEMLLDIGFKHLDELGLTPAPQEGR